MSYAKRVAAETETEETTYSYYPQEKDRMETNDVQIEIEKGNKRRKNEDKSTSAAEERRQHTRGIRILEARKELGGV